MNRSAKITATLIVAFVCSFLISYRLFLPTEAHAQSSKKFPDDYSADAAPTADDFLLSHDSGSDTMKKLTHGNLPKSLLQSVTAGCLLYNGGGSFGTVGRVTVGDAGLVVVTAPAVETEILTTTTTATGDDPVVTVSQGRVATTDATPTTIRTIPITASKTYKIHAEVVARRTAGSGGTANDGAAYVREASYTTKTGTVTLLGSVGTIYTAEDQAGWDVTFAVSSTNVLIQVTGAANNTVTWHLSKCEVSSVGS